MPESGGPTTQSGTYFQNTVAAWFMARMLHDAIHGPSENRITRVRCEAPEEVDDVMVTFERGVHYVQAKEALSASGGAWTGLWRHFWKQFIRRDYNHEHDRLVLWGGQHTDLFMGLQEMVKRAQSVPSGPARRQATEFIERLTKSQLGWLDAITAIIHNYEIEAASGHESVEITQSDVFELLQTVEVIAKGSAKEIEKQAVNTFLSGMPDVAMIFPALRDLAAEKARIRGAWTYEELRATLEAKGLHLVSGERRRDDADEDRSAMEQELAMHRSNLRTLRLQAAVYGAGETPLHLLNQIKAEERAIQSLEERLGR